MLLALVVVGAAVFLLRPDAGEAADGSQRLATTTTTTPTSTTVAESEAVDDLDTPLPVGLEVAGLGGSVSSFGFDVVRGPDGQYYGSPTFGGDSRTDLPEIYVSLNGQNWIQVETRLLDDTDGTPDGVLQSIQLPDGQLPGPS